MFAAECRERSPRVRLRCSIGICCKECPGVSLGTCALVASRGRHGNGNRSSQVKLLGLVSCLFSCDMSCCVMSCEVIS